MGDKIAKISGVKLAFIGDAVFDLYVRTRILREMPHKNINDLHSVKVKFVKAAAQAAFINKIKPDLSEWELDVFKRARNSSTKAAPRSASATEYRNATGFEALLGALYLEGNEKRLGEIMASCMDFGLLGEENNEDGDEEQILEKIE